MPKINDDVLRCVFFLYRSVEAAERGDGAGGCGFVLVHKNTFYGITNYHVAIKNGCSVVRITSANGETCIREFDPSDWTFIPQGADLAAIELPKELFETEKYVLKLQISAVPWGMLATEATIRRHGINAGEDVFMVGRFIDHDGGIKNQSSVRFGNISSMPTPVPQPHGVVGDCYTIDMHSRSGFSGSPVFVFRTFGQDLTKLPKIQANESRVHGGIAVQVDFQPVFALLGIHCGQFEEEWEIKVRKGKRLRRSSTEYVVGMSGMTIVVPAKRIEELLNLPKFSEPRDRKYKANLREAYRKQGLPIPEQFDSDEPDASNQTTPSTKPSRKVK